MDELHGNPKPDSELLLQALQYDPSRQEKLPDLYWKTSPEVGGIYISK